MDITDGRIYDLLLSLLIRRCKVRTKRSGGL